MENRKEPRITTVGNTEFIHNSDYSGDIRISNNEDDDDTMMMGVVEIPFLDLKRFMDDMIKKTRVQAIVKGFHDQEDWKGRNKINETMSKDDPLKGLRGPAENLGSGKTSDQWYESYKDEFAKVKRLQAENEKLRIELKKAIKEYDRIVNKERAEVLEVLEEVEWQEKSEGGRVNYRCYFCHNIGEDEHTDDCKLNALIKKTKEGK